MDTDSPFRDPLIKQGIVSLWNLSMPIPCERSAVLPLPPVLKDADDRYRMFHPLESCILLSWT
jgi:hypothetical protein